MLSEEEYDSTNECMYVWRAGVPGAHLQPRGHCGREGRQERVRRGQEEEEAAQRQLQGQEEGRRALHGRGIGAEY